MSDSFVQFISTKIDVIQNHFRASARAEALAELFGDETLLPDGSKAAHGFAALKALDSNNDNVFSALDARFADVRLWRDLDQDGISDAGELQGLAAGGVASINLASTASGTNYGDAILAQSGSFTRVNGGTGQVGSFILAQSSFVREFVPIAVSDAAKALPNIGGSGWVRDLQEAATLSPDLISATPVVQDAATLRHPHLQANARSIEQSGYFTPELICDAHCANLA